ncbi:MAG: hypothetical protein HZA34_01235 [Candidatus Pacebacteria bacterium]|nr:hypothetical protein [Candidatus Paceibacterota bacterium]
MKYRMEDEFIAVLNKKLDRFSVEMLESMCEMGRRTCIFLDAMHQVNQELIAYLQGRGPKPNFKDRRLPEL